MNTLTRLRNLISPSLDLLFPPTCWAGGRGEVLFGLSQSAREQIALLSAQSFCCFCGLTIGPHESHNRKNPCARCGTRDVGTDRIARAGTFSEPLVTLVHRLKFARAWELAPTLAPFLYQAILRVSEVQRVPVDLLVPVPLHWRRQAKRGFNQAGELARETAALAHWPVANLLIRTRHTPEQALTQTATDRRDNLRGAFACRRNVGRQIAGKHLWLIDDVSTTGATLHAAATALRKLPASQKPASISAAVLCVTDHQSPPPVPAFSQDLRANAAVQPAAPHIA